MLNRANTLVLGVILGSSIGILVIIGYSRMPSPPRISELIGEPGVISKNQVESTAPDFELSSLSGERVLLSSLRGRVVLINFWATWCGPCRLEMPAFQSRANRFPDDIVILAINEQDSPGAIRAYMLDLNLTFDVLLDTEGDVHRQYLVRGFPTTFLVDREGILRVQHVGVMTDEQLDVYIKDLGLSD